MKKIFILLMACVMLMPLHAQQTDTIPEVPEAETVAEEVPVVEEVPEVAEEAPAVDELPALEEVPEVAEAPESPSYGDTVNVLNRVEVIETPDNTRVTIGENEVFIVEENGDTVKVVLGSRGISIIEGDNGTEVKVIDMDDNSISKMRHKRKKRFRPHYAGFEFGLSQYLTPDFSLVMNPGEEYMDLNTGKSWNWNINVVDLGVGLGTSYVGLATGLGFEFSYFNFDGQNGIMKDPVTRETVEYIPSYAGNISKSKLHTSYITIPLILEFQIPTSGRGRIYFSGGVTGSAKLWSSTKIKYREAGDKSKEKTKGDYNLTPFRWGLTARAGYKNFGIFANYSMSSLFKPGRGPELYPFQVGLAFTW